MKSSPENRLARQLSARYIFATTFLTFALSFLLTACSGVNASTPSQAATTDPTGKSPLSYAPAAINFGTVKLSSKAATYVLSLTNAGTSVEVIESATIVPTPTFSLQGWTGPVTVDPGQTVQLRATFAPKNVGNYSGTLTLVTVRLPDGKAFPLQPQSQVKIPVIAVASAENTDPPPVVGVTVSPGSAGLQSGQSKQFTAAVTGTSNTAVTWTAELGSISSSGFYTAPTLAGQIVDTVSAISAADPTKYGSASVTVSVNAGSVNTFYVDPVNGNDSNDGTSQATAWKTICKANSSASLGTSGTTINLLPGTFSISAQGSCFNGSYGLNLSLSGTSTQHVVWIGQNDPRTCIGSCTTIFTGANTYGIYVTATYADLIQLEVTQAGVIFGLGNPGTPPQGDHDSLQKSWIHDVRTTCPTNQGESVLTSETATGGLIDSNVINNVGVMGNCTGDAGFQGPHGIYIAGYHWQVTNNLVSNAAGYGIHSYHNACETLIANNTVVHNYSGGILVSAGPDTSNGCNPNGGDYYTVDNNISIYNSWGCGVVVSGTTAGIANGIVSYNIGSNATHNVGNNNYLIGNWSYSGAGCTNSPGTNNSFLYNTYSGAPFAGASTTTLSATTLPENSIVNPCSSGTWNSTACNVVPIARGGSWDWHIVSGGPFDAAGGSGCAGSPGYASPCVPAYDAAGVTQTFPSSIGAYK